MADPFSKAVEFLGQDVEGGKKKPLYPVPGVDPMQSVQEQSAQEQSAPAIPDVPQKAVSAARPGPKPDQFFAPDFEPEHKATWKLFKKYGIDTDAQSYREDYRGTYLNRPEEAQREFKPVDKVISGSQSYRPFTDEYLEIGRQLRMYDEALKWSEGRGKDIENPMFNPKGQKLLEDPTTSQEMLDYLYYNLPPLAKTRVPERKHQAKARAVVDNQRLKSPNVRAQRIAEEGQAAIEMGEALPGDTQITLYDETGEIVGTRFRSPTPEKITAPKTTMSVGKTVVEGARRLFGETGAGVAEAFRSGLASIPGMEHTYEEGPSPLGLIGFSPLLQPIMPSGEDVLEFVGARQTMSDEDAVSSVLDNIKITKKLSQALRTPFVTGPDAKLEQYAIPLTRGSNNTMAVSLLDMRRQIHENYLDREVERGELRPVRGSDRWYELAEEANKVLEEWKLEQQGVPIIDRRTRIDRVDSLIRGEDWTSYLLGGPATKLGANGLDYVLETMDENLELGLEPDGTVSSILYGGSAPLRAMLHGGITSATDDETFTLGEDITSLGKSRFAWFLEAGAFMPIISMAHNVLIGTSIEDVPRVFHEWSFAASEDVMTGGGTLLDSMKMPNLPALPGTLDYAAQQLGIESPIEVRDTKSRELAAKGVKLGGVDISAEWWGYDEKMKAYRPGPNLVNSVLSPVGMLANAYYQWVVTPQIGLGVAGTELATEVIAGQEIPAALSKHGFVSDVLDPNARFHPIVPYLGSIEGLRLAQLGNLIPGIGMELFNPDMYTVTSAGVGKVAKMVKPALKARYLKGKKAALDDINDPEVLKAMQYGDDEVGPQEWQDFQKKHPIMAEMVASRVAARLEAEGNFRSAPEAEFGDYIGSNVVSKVRRLSENLEKSTDQSKSMEELAALAEEISNDIEAILDGVAQDEEILKLVRGAVPKKARKLANKLDEAGEAVDAVDPMYKIVSDMTGDQVFAYVNAFRAAHIRLSAKINDGATNPGGLFQFSHGVDDMSDGIAVTSTFDPTNPETWTDLTGMTEELQQIIDTPTPDLIKQIEAGDHDDRLAEVFSALIFRRKEARDAEELEALRISRAKKAEPTKPEAKVEPEVEAPTEAPEAVAAPEAPGDPLAYLDEKYPGLRGYIRLADARKKQKEAGTYFDEDPALVVAEAGEAVAIPTDDLPHRATSGYRIPYRIAHGAEEGAEDNLVVEVTRTDPTKKEYKETMVKRDKLSLSLESELADTAPVLRRLHVSEEVLQDFANEDLTVSGRKRTVTVRVFRASPDAPNEPIGKHLYRRVVDEFENVEDAEGNVSQNFSFLDELVVEPVEAAEAGSIVSRRSDRVVDNQRQTWDMRPPEKLQVDPEYPTREYEEYIKHLVNKAQDYFDRPRRYEATGLGSDAAIDSDFGREMLETAKYYTDELLKVGENLGPAERLRTKTNVSLIEQFIRTLVDRYGILQAAQAPTGPAVRTVSDAIGRMLTGDSALTDAMSKAFDKVKKPKTQPKPEPTAKPTAEPEPTPADTDDLDFAMMDQVGADKPERSTSDIRNVLPVMRAVAELHTGTFSLRDIRELIQSKTGWWLDRVATSRAIDDLIDAGAIRRIEPDEFDPLRDPGEAARVAQGRTEQQKVYAAGEGKIDLSPWGIQGDLDARDYPKVLAAIETNVPQVPRIENLRSSPVEGDTLLESAAWTEITNKLPNIPTVPRVKMVVRGGRRGYTQDAEKMKALVARIESGELDSQLDIIWVEQLETLRRTGFFGERAKTLSREALLDVALDSGLVEKKGSWYFVREDNVPMGQGTLQAITYLESQSELKAKVQQLVDQKVPNIDPWERLPASVEQLRSALEARREVLKPAELKTLEQRTRDNLQALNVDQLKKRAKELGATGYSKKNKSQIIELIEDLEVARVEYEELVGSQADMVALQGAMSRRIKTLGKTFEADVGELNRMAAMNSEHNLANAFRATRRALTTKREQALRAVRFALLKMGAVGLDKLLEAKGISRKLAPEELMRRMAQIQEVDPENILGAKRAARVKDVDRAAMNESWSRVKRLIKSGKLMEFRNEMLEESRAVGNRAKALERFQTIMGEEIAHIQQDLTNGIEAVKSGKFPNEPLRDISWNQTALRNALIQGEEAERLLGRPLAEGEQLLDVDTYNKNITQTYGLFDLALMPVSSRGGGTFGRVRDIRMKSGQVVVDADDISDMYEFERALAKERDISRVDTMDVRYTRVLLDSLKDRKMPVVGWGINNWYAHGAKMLAAFKVLDPDTARFGVLSRSATAVGRGAREKTWRIFDELTTIIRLAPAGNVTESIVDYIMTTNKMSLSRQDAVYRPTTILNQGEVIWTRFMRAMRNPPIEAVGGVAEDPTLDATGHFLNALSRMFISPDRAQKVGRSADLIKEQMALAIQTRKSFEDNSVTRAVAKAKKEGTPWTPELEAETVQKANELYDAQRSDLKRALLAVGYDLQDDVAPGFKEFLAFAHALTRLHVGDIVTGADEVLLDARAVNTLAIVACSGAMLDDMLTDMVGAIGPKISRQMANDIISTITGDYDEIVDIEGAMEGFIRLGIPFSQTKRMSSREEGDVFKIFTAIREGKVAVVPSRVYQELTKELYKWEMQFDPEIMRQRDRLTSRAMNSFMRLNSELRRAMTTGLFFNPPHWVTTTWSDFWQMHESVGFASATQVTSANMLATSYRVISSGSDALATIPGIGPKLQQTSLKIKQLIARKQGLDPNDPAVIDRILPSLFETWTRNDVLKIWDHRFDGTFDLGDGLIIKADVLRRQMVEDGVFDFSLTQDSIELAQYSFLVSMAADTERTLKSLRKQGAPPQQIAQFEKHLADIEEAKRSKEFFGFVGKLPGVEAVSDVTAQAQAAARPVVKVATAPIRAVYGVKEAAAEYASEAMRHFQQRQRAALYLNVLQKTKSREKAREAVMNALYDWNHGMTPFEMQALSKYFLFYRFTRLNIGQGIKKLLAPFVEPDDVDTLSGLVLRPGEADGSTDAIRGAARARQAERQAAADRAAPARPFATAAADAFVGGVKLSQSRLSRTRQQLVLMQEFVDELERQSGYPEHFGGKLSPEEAYDFAMRKTHPSYADMQFGFVRGAPNFVSQAWLANSGRKVDMMNTKLPEASSIQQLELMTLVLGMFGYAAGMASASVDGDLRPGMTMDQALEIIPWTADQMLPGLDQIVTSTYESMSGKKSYRGLKPLPAGTEANYKAALKATGMEGYLQQINEAGRLGVPPAVHLFLTNIPYVSHQGRRFGEALGANPGRTFDEFLANAFGSIHGMRPMYYSSREEFNRQRELSAQALKERVKNIERRPTNLPPMPFLYDRLDD